MHVHYNNARTYNKDIQLHSDIAGKALWTALGFSMYLQSNIKAITDTEKKENEYKSHIAVCARVAFRYRT